MLRRSLTTVGLLAVFLLYVPGPAHGASGQVALPLKHRLNGILVDVYRPKLLFGHGKVSRGFVATRDGLVLAPLAGLEEADLGDEVKLQWMDSRSTEGWLVWKDEEVGYAILRILDPMPLFPAVEWRRDLDLKPGERLLAPGPMEGGEPSLSKAFVAGLEEMRLPSGRPIGRAILLKPTLGTGPLRGPLLDESGFLVGMVSSLDPPSGFDPGTVVAVSAGALRPDLRAARSMRPPRQYTSPPPIVARPSYSIGIGIGSGGVYPRIGIGFGGVGPSRRAGSRWVTNRESPYMRQEQEATDRAKTEALEKALEQQTGLEPSGSAPLLTNTRPLAQKEASPGGTESWRAGSSTVASTAGAGGPAKASPKAGSPSKPSISSTWNPAGPPLTASPSKPTASQGTSWPVVVEPKVDPSLRREQQTADEAKTEELEKQLGEKGVEGSSGESSSEEFRVLAAPSSSGASSSSLGGGEDSELAALRARNEALERELERLRQSVSESE